MAEPRTMPSGKDLRKASLKISLEQVAGSKVDKNRRRKSITSQFAHPLTGENVKERQVKTLYAPEKKSCLNFWISTACTATRYF